MIEEKYIGLFLAISGSVAIGTSFIITKKGLIDAAEKHSGYSSESYAYLRNGTWWAGMLTMVVGELANFAAYAFAPAILVAPLGACSVLIGAILASFFLQESLGKIGRVGCGLCFVGSTIVVLHAPEDKDVQTVDEILTYAVQPAFLFYCFVVSVASLILIYRVAPKYGTKTPLVYVSICSLVGSISIMAIKGFGVALKLTFSGNNQLTHVSTYVFALTIGGCIAVQMNYFNKALDLFSTNVVNPIYYVFFTTATSIASVILFKGYEGSGGINTLSLLCGYVVTFLGVYLLTQKNKFGGPTPIHPDSAGLRPSMHRRSLLETRQSLAMPARLSLDSDEGENGLSAGLPLTSPDGRHFTISNESDAENGFASHQARSPTATHAPKGAHVLFDRYDDVLDERSRLRDDADSGGLESEHANGVSSPRSPTKRY